MTAIYEQETKNSWTEKLSVVPGAKPPGKGGGFGGPLGPSTWRLHYIIAYRNNYGLLLRNCLLHC